MGLEHHDCDRFRAQGLMCPFEELREDDDFEDDKSHRIPIAFPARRAADELGDNLLRFPTIAHGEPEMRKALERMAAIQQEGGLRSIPRAIPTLPDLPPVVAPGRGRGAPFPSPVLGGRGIISILAAIAIMSTLRSMRSPTFNPTSQAVQTSERHVARGLTRLGQTGRIGTPGGFGGLHTQAATFRPGQLGLRPKVTIKGNNELRKLLGFGLKGPSAGFDEFSETGF